MFVTFGVSSAQLRRRLPQSDSAPPPASAPPTVARQPRPTPLGAGDRVALPTELWRQVVAALPLEDALALRTVNAWGFDLVADSHRSALAARVANASLQPWRPSPSDPATLGRLLDQERAVELSICPRSTLDYDRAVHRLVRQKSARGGPRDALAVHALVFARMQAVLAAAHRAERVQLSEGLPFVPGVAARPLALPPNTQVLQLGRLYFPGPAGGNSARELPAFFAANADRPVRRLELFHSLGVTLGRFDRVLPLFAWRLTSLTLNAVPLEDDAFAALLRGDFSQLRSLTLACDQQWVHMAHEVDVAVSGHQLRALCALPWPRLERLELTGNFRDADLSAMTARPWPMLASLQLGSPQLTNRSARTLAALPAGRLASLEVRGKLDLGALPELMRPRLAAYVSLRLMQLQTPSPRDVVRATVPDAFDALDTPVRMLWVGQAEALRSVHVSRFRAALQPFGHRLDRFELHTCVPTYEKVPQQMFALAFERLAPRTKARFTHCGVDAAAADAQGH